MTERLLDIEKLQLAFGHGPDQSMAVDGVSLHVDKGQTVALVGESGSGKSVTALSVLQLLPYPFAHHPAGRINYRGQELMGAGPSVLRAVRGNEISMIFQEPMTSFSPLHTVGDQICEVLRIHTTLTPKEQRERCEEMLGMVGFSNPARVFDMYSFELSGGMRQRTMIAMALICEPALLIADEPTTALDVTIQAQILKLLRELQSRLHMAILLITHDLGVVANMADEVSVIYRGEIMEAGPVDAIFRSPGHPYLKGLMSAIPTFDMPRETRLKPLRDIDTHVEHLLDKLAAPPRNTEAAPDVILSVKDLSKTYFTKKQDWQVGVEAKAVPAVDGVSFDVRRGECLGLVGESGCGKTTLSKILMHAVSPDTGSVTFRDGDGAVDVLGATGDELQNLRAKMQMVFQDPIASLSPRMTVGNILREPFEIHKRGTREQRNVATSSLLDAVGLGKNALQRYPHSFSGGQRQRIGISRSLAVAPQFIICDEPVSALDVSVQAQILNLLKDLQKDMGLTYLFISHNLAVIDYMADRVAVMWAGKIVEMAPRSVIMQSPIHPYTRSLMEAVPFPDLDRQLDFDHVEATGSISEQAWPAAFRQDPHGEPLIPVDVGEEHYVLARASADVTELQP